MAGSEVLSASLEDYLEAIFHIVAEKQAARGKDICRRIKVSSPSVTGALKSLAARGLVNYAPYGVVTLTERGKAAAEDVVRRHEALRDFFTKVLLIGEEAAEEASCKMEHAIRPDILERLIQFVDFVEICPWGGADWVQDFGYGCKHGDKIGDCEKCVSSVLAEIRRDKKRMQNAEAAPMNLRALKPGSKARVVKIKGQGETRKRLTDMGVTRGTLLEVDRVAPIGDLIQIKIKGYHLSLSKQEAETIDVDPLRSD